jgi:polyisoprenyl-phosphate glycosyltransferase
VSLALALALVVLHIVGSVPLHGATALLLAGLFLGGTQLICLGILGEYVGRIYDEVRARPPFVVAAIVGKTRLPPTTEDPQI